MVVKRVSSAASLMYTSCWTVNLETEREPKWRAHQRWNVELPRERSERGPTREIAQEAVHIESRMQLLFSFEKMAIRDAVREAEVHMSSTLQPSVARVDRSVAHDVCAAFLSASSAPKHPTVMAA